MYLATGNCMGDTLESGPRGPDAEGEEPLGHATTLPASSGTPTPDGRGLTAEQPGRYEFDRNRDSVRELGRGGLGRVLLAYDSHLGREVAWKEILPEARQQADTPSDGVTGTARFLREARVTGQLEHPSIVPVYELGSRADGTVYYTMKVVRGRTLREALRECSTLRERLRLLPQFASLCQAIAFAHSRGVIHRDIKPENVMLGEFGETVVLDWGIAKLKQTDQPVSTASEPPPPPSDWLRTSVGSLVGTPAYMSPEQALGQVDVVDERSDVWSLGAVLYELLTGQALVGSGSPQAILTVILAGKYKPPLEVDDAIPRELVAICTRALQRNPENRYPGARELAAELESFQSGARVGAYSYTSWELLARFARRNKALLSAAAIVFVLSIVAAAVSSAYYRKELRAHRVAQYHMAQALEEKACSLNAQADYTSAAVYAAASMLQNPASPSSSYHDPGFVAQVPGSKNTLIEAVSSLYRARLGSVLRLYRRIETSAEAREVSLAPDASRVAIGQSDGTIELWDVESGKMVFRRKMHSSTVVAIRFAPDGRLAASGGYDGIKLWNPSTGEPVGELTGHRREVRALVFSPDGATLYSGADDKTVRVWDAAGRQERAVLEGHRAGVMSLALSRDGKRLVSGSRDGEIRLWSASTGAGILVRAAHTDVVSDLAFAGDGTLISVSWDRTVARWNEPDLELLHRFQAGNEWVTSAGLIQGGRWLAALGLDGGLSLLDTATDATLLVVHAYSTGVENLTASDTSGVVAFPSAPRTVEVWKQNGAPGVRIIGSHAGFVQAVAYSPDGTKIASASFDKTARIWDARTGKVLDRLEGFSDYVHTVKFSPDGRWLGALSRDGTLLVWDVSARQDHSRLRGAAIALEFDWSPDSAKVAVGGGDGVLWFFDVQAKDVQRRADIPFPNVGGVRFLDPQTVVLSSYSGVAPLVVWNLETGTSRPGTGDRKCNAFEWLPKRRTIVCVRASNEISLHDIESGRVTTSPASDARGEFPRASADERYLFVGGDRALIVVDLLTREPILRLPFPGGFGEAVISPDGRQVACTSGSTVMTFPFDPEWIASMRSNPAAQLAESESIAGQHLDGFELHPIAPPR
jgi:eukaryotic-like serine/threonine-protein kinase